MNEQANKASEGTRRCIACGKPGHGAATCPNTRTWVLMEDDEGTHSPVAVGGLDACLAEAGRRAKAAGLHVEALLETTPDELVAMVDGKALLWVRCVPLL